MLFISIITSPRYQHAGIHRARTATRGTALGRADGSHSEASKEGKRWRTDVLCMWVCLCVCVGCGLVVGGSAGGRGKHQGDVAAERQASRQACGLLITQGLPPPLGAVSNMREHKQPPQNTSLTQPATGYVCALTYASVRVS